MKIIHFNSGLGNQMFQYMFYLYQSKKGNSVYGYYNKKWLKQHNGLEFHKVINCDLPKSTCFTRLIACFCRLFHHFDIQGHFFCSDNNYNPNSLYYSGYWQDKKYFQHIEKPLFRDFKLNKQNREILEKMQAVNSVSIHIRRGDYLQTDCMADLCSTTYYEEALKLIELKISEPIYFVFSDDIHWAKEHIRRKSIYFIDWNKGGDSYLDMYLMSRCKAHIIANSSFSFWGAYMSEKDILTIYPSKWFNDQNSPNIAPDEWIKI